MKRNPSGLTTIFICENPQNDMNINAIDGISLSIRSVLVYGLLKYEKRKLPKFFEELMIPKWLKP